MSIPTEMHAISIEDKQLVYGTQPTPSIGAQQVLIQSAYAGLNRADIFQRKGTYPPPEGASPLPGLEVSGTIVAVGEDVQDWKQGDDVCALLPGGGYAAYCVAEADQCLPIPQGLGLKEAAALPETFLTVWMCLKDQARLQEGERVLIHGGSSGIGTTAIQLCNAWGAEVFATAGTAEKCALCETLGAQAINYREQDYVEEIKRATDGEGVDVVLDMVGGDYINRNFKAMRRGGRLISIAFLQGATCEVNAGALLLKHLSWIGVTLRSRSNEEKANYINALQTYIWPLLAKGKIAPVIDSVFPLHEAAKAHAHMEEGLHCGKILLQID